MSKQVQESLRQMVRARDWEKFHTPENLAKSISIESAELLECFQWNSDFNIENVKEELADVLTYAYILCEKLQVTPDDIVLEKIKITEKKYPVEKSYGVSTKYDKL